MLMGAAEWCDSGRQKGGRCVWCVDTDDKRRGEKEGGSHLLIGGGACRTRESYWQLSALCLV